MGDRGKGYVPLPRVVDPRTVLTDEQWAKLHPPPHPRYSYHQFSLLFKLIGEGVPLPKAASISGIGYQTAKRHVRKLTDPKKLNQGRLMIYRQVVARARLLLKHHPDKSFRACVMMAAPAFGVKGKTVIERFYEGLVT